jgi:hypothetical protein
MTADQALSILDQAASRAALTRADHEAVLQALKLLRDLVHQPEQNNNGG